ncbi:MAG: LysR family transcriptional regulator [Clostridia bacterium]|nr:LysR family transcriptional regulator [Clostridia bacterium]
MTIRHLRIFVAVCEDGSITGAARGLYMTQPAVSLAIRELEEGYGLKLFDRLSRGIQLTGEGRRMLEYASHVISLFDEMESAMKSPEAAGELRIGSSLTIGARLLPGYTQQLVRRCPGMKPRVFIDNSNNVIDSVIHGRRDVGLVEGAVRDDALVATAFMEDALLAVCGRENPLAAEISVTIDRFLAQPLLLRERGSGTRELFQSAITLMGKTCVPAWESISTTALIHAVEAGCGVSVLPRRLVEEHIHAGKLLKINLENIDLRRSFFLIHHRNKYLSAGLKAFMSVVMERRLCSQEQ